MNISIKVLFTALFFIMIDSSNNNTYQQTLSEPLLIEGIGLHSGIEVSMKLIPAESNTGIKFYRTDLKKNNEIDALWSNVSNTQLSTTISNIYGAKVSTIEHLMSALSGLHIDNLKIEINGPEVPIMDGSSKDFVDDRKKSQKSPTSSQQSFDF